MTQALTKSPGQIAYEADVAARPEYRPGEPRKPWSMLTDEVRVEWERRELDAQLRAQGVIP